MTDSLRKVDYFYTFVPNTAGQGSKILATLAEEGVNLLAFSGFPSGRRAQLDLSPRKTGFLVQGDDRVGAMTATLESLARAKINVTACDAVTAGDGRFAAIFWVKPQSVAKAAKVLGAR
jgi:prephenate dehydratase